MEKGTDGNKYRQFKCRCDCGVEKRINASNVIRGISKTCGCGERISRYGRKHAVDLTGRKYGKLTAVKDSGKRAKNSSVIWECVCECGGVIEVSAGDLNRGRITNCGCAKTHANTKDIRGFVFGNLTVIDIDRNRTRKKGDRLHWQCKCKCGNIASIAATDLSSGNTLSCGCAQRSNHENIIEKFLVDAGLQYERQKRFEDCRNIRPLPFDFYLPAQNTAIEYDGRQHFEPIGYFGGEVGFEQRVRNDEIKNTYCANMGIQMIRIPYTMNLDSIKDLIESLRPRNE